MRGVEIGGADHADAADALDAGKLGDPIERGCDARRLRRTCSTMRFLAVDREHLARERGAERVAAERVAVVERAILAAAEGVEDASVTSVAAIGNERRRTPCRGTSCRA